MVISLDWALVDHKNTVLDHKNRKDDKKCNITSLESKAQGAYDFTATSPICVWWLEQFPKNIRSQVITSIGHINSDFLIMYR